MRVMKNFILMLTISNLFSNVYAFQWSEEFITIPEKTNYTQTSTHKDVMKFVNAAKTKSPLVHVETIATSLEGRAVPMLVLANPKITSPAEADASGKPVIYLQGNIHGGEVEGKEALMILMREILFGDKKDLLSNQILYTALIFSPITAWITIKTRTVWPAVILHYLNNFPYEAWTTFITAN